MCDDDAEGGELLPVGVRYGGERSGGGNAFDTVVDSFCEQSNYFCGSVISDAIGTLETKVAARGTDSWSRMEKCRWAGQDEVLRMQDARDHEHTSR